MPDPDAIAVPTLTAEFPVVGDDPHIDAPLRATVRRLSTLLGGALADQHGQEMLDLVEQVRKLTKEAKSSESEASALDVQNRLAELSIEQATTLTRAFSQYFLLANAAEQVYRVRAMQERPADESWMPRTVRAISEELGPEGLQKAFDSLDVRLVFTAHPTEASRRAVLTKLRRISDILGEETEEGSIERRRQDRDLAELIETLWQTDELRRHRPTPQDEARNALYYLRQIFRQTMPEMLDDLREELRAHDADMRDDQVPLRFGSWIGGDRDGNPFVTAQVTREVLELQAETAIDFAVEVISDLILELSVSSELTGEDEQLMESLREDLSHGGAVDPVQQELYRQEPYRLKLGAMRSKLRATQERIRSGEAHVHGRDYRDSAELQDDFRVLREALRRHGGERVADGNAVERDGGERAAAVLGGHRDDRRLCARRRVETGARLPTVSPDEQPRGEPDGAGRVAARRRGERGEPRARARGRRAAQRPVWRVGLLVARTAHESRARRSPARRTVDRHR